MKRNTYGINFDLGVPLSSPEEFTLLYIDVYPDAYHKLAEWFHHAIDPIIVAGQIGTGKTTLIEKVRQEFSDKVHIQIKFDTDLPTYSRGAFWGFFLGKLLARAHTLKCNLKAFHLSEDFLGIAYQDNGIKELSSRLCDKPLSITEFSSKEKLYGFVETRLDIIKSQLRDICDIIEKKTKQKLTVLAEGIDKFYPTSLEFLFLSELLDFLKQYKTLFEINLILLFARDSQWSNDRKIILAGAPSHLIKEILCKRLGVYHQSREAILPILSQLSGGNIRQALRLLIEYDYATGRKRYQLKEAIEYACRRVRVDLLNVSALSGDYELLNVIRRDKFIAPGTLRELRTREITQNGVYQNLVFITGEPDNQLRWPAEINPLLLPALENFRHIPQSPETRELYDWAQLNDISPFGLEIDQAHLRQDQYFDIIGSSGKKTPALSLLDILDSISSFFLDSERKDTVIITYENKDLAILANDFMIGRAGSYNEIKIVDLVIDTDKTHLELFFEDIHNLAPKKKPDGYSILFERTLTNNEIILLDRWRDIFIEYKMIWWLPFTDFLEYQKQWPQLRQFLRIFRLDQYVAGTITREEIEQDLLNLEIIRFPKNHKLDIKARLERILTRLLEKK